MVLPLQTTSKPNSQNGPPFFSIDFSIDCCPLSFSIMISKFTATPSQLLVVFFTAGVAAATGSSSLTGIEIAATLSCFLICPLSIASFHLRFAASSPSTPVEASSFHLGIIVVKGSRTTDLTFGGFGCNYVDMRKCCLGKETLKKNA